MLGPKTTKLGNLILPSFRCCCSSYVCSVCSPRGSIDNVAIQDSASSANSIDIACPRIQPCKQQNYPPQGVGVSFIAYFLMSSFSLETQINVNLWEEFKKLSSINLFGNSELIDEYMYYVLAQGAQKLSSKVEM